jgi:hypothetical protein
VVGSRDLDFIHLSTRSISSIESKSLCLKSSDVVISRTNGSNTNPALGLCTIYLYGKYFVCPVFKLLSSLLKRVTRTGNIFFSNGNSCSHSDCKATRKSFQFIRYLLI